MSEAPDKVLNPSDPGDETQRRYRYQAVRAAVYVLALFDDDEGIDEVFCEQHEDILIKYRTGRFLGVQIKTKADGSVPLKAGDEEVVRSIRRFIDTEKEFPNYFDGFVLTANCGFWKERKSSSNLAHLIDEAQGKDLKTAPKPVMAFLKKLCPKPKVPKLPKAGRKQTQKKSDKDSPGKPSGDGSPPATSEPHEAQLARALAVLGKIRLDTAPPLASLDETLLAALARCPVVGANQLYSDLQAIAAVLIGEILEASAKPHASPKQHYFALCRDPKQAQVDSIIAAKQFARARVEEVIRRGFGRSSTPSSDGKFSLDKLPQGTRIQQAKMTGGTIVIDDIEEAVQQRQAAEYVFSTWLNKYGLAKANGQYQDVRSAVLTECSEAQEQASRNGSPYGAEMLRLVKQRIRVLYETSGATLHGLRYDQLLGVAGILTEECPVWWSDKFNLDAEVAS